MFISLQDVGYRSALRFGQEQIGGARHRFECVQNFGLYRATEQKKIRIAVLNTAPESQLDYLRTVFRETSQRLGYSLVSAGERQVERLSENVLEAAISQLAKNRPDIVLAIISDEYGSSESGSSTL